MQTPNPRKADDLIESVTLFKRRNQVFRLDVFPFAIVYLCLLPALFGVFDKPEARLDRDYGQGLLSEFTWKELALYVFPIPLLAHFGLFLAANGFSSVKCALGNSAVFLAKEADTALVQATKNSGKDRAVPVHHGTDEGEVVLFGTAHKLAQHWFEFQKKVYDFTDTERGSAYTRRLYPTRGSIQSILSSPGHDEVSRAVSLSLWGKNEFDIPLPSFWDLYQEHLIAPFFLFQVVCLCLWSLDEYWYYSAVTLLMLMLFEGMLCKQRQNSLQMLREMRRPAMPLYRLSRGEVAANKTSKGKANASGYTWDVVSSESLVPGDVISLVSTIATRVSGAATDSETKDAQVILPCDAVIIGGSCVVNEAMLTGESTPQVKESVYHAQMELNSSTRASGDTEGQDCVVEIDLDSTNDSACRRYQLYGGTTLLQHSQADKATEGPAMAQIPYPPPPNKGCLAVVVRTGFGTTQGELMRKILYASERVSSSANETFYFIGLLVIFALVASALVLHEGLMDESRNRFKLILHCIMIITSVVPPELPMELSLAVTHSLAALSKAHVFCTEPFRIPFAGRLNTLCFDKTGTLTQDKMLFRGLVAAPEETDEHLFQDEVHDDTAVSRSRTPSLGLQEVSASPDTIVELDLSKVPVVSVAVMGVCHSLFRDPRSGQIVGDPLEMATFNASGYRMDNSGMQYTAHLKPAESAEKQISSARVLHRYPFSSALKRMSVLAELVVVGSGKSGVSMSKEVTVICKGAPEVLLSKLSIVPHGYRETYLYHMSRGKRVLALAYKAVRRAAQTEVTVKSYSREEVESDLLFAGFIVFDSELKADTKGVMKVLRHIDANIVVITGDSAYTAADVARRLKLTVTASAKKSASEGSDTAAKTTAQPLWTVKLLMVVQGSDQENRIVWRTASEGDAMEPIATDISFDPLTFTTASIAELAVRNTLCVTGSALVLLCEYKSGSGAEWYYQVLRKLCTNISIFARVSPSQKESIVRALNDTGRFTLMCGDGTNDVGALRAAHVGVSVINCPDLEDKVEERIMRKQSPALSLPETPRAEDTLRNRKKSSKSTGSSGSTPQDRVARAMAEMQMQDMDPTIVKLGDASIASPFTSRRTSIDAVLTVIRHGRCTLVTTIQIFKILALNCLCSAYLMSALYLRGLKQGDYQMTAAGLVTAGLFFFLSQAKPVHTLSPHAPPHSVFASSVLTSIIGQFVVHLLCLFAVLALCEHYELYGVDMEASPDSLSDYARHMYERQHHRRISIPDSAFQPTLMNSAIYILSLVIQTNNFVVNYRGEPFTQNLSDNKQLLMSVRTIYFVIFVVLSDVFEPLNDLLELEKFPCHEFQYLLGLILVFNLGSCWCVERLCQKWEVSSTAPK